MELLNPAHPNAELETRLAALADRPWAADAYLAGTAALALYLGHRRPRGLDLMSPGNRLTPQKRRDLLGDLLDLDPGTRVETARDGYLFARFGDGTAIKVFYYPYPLVDPERSYGGLAVASAIDLGLMKIAAIISRGTRRDFTDLYLLCRRLPLAGLLERSADKFGHVRDFELQALKGLADLTLARQEPEIPGGTGTPTWAEVEAWVADEVRRLGREKVGLG
ncbi:MAG: hypothetical protein KDD11_00605 [Acidobacteria bacterium]|nr:hypothetical protein [Acidobacteriota bacterium]